MPRRRVSLQRRSLWSAVLRLPPRHRWCAQSKSGVLLLNSGLVVCCTSLGIGDVCCIRWLLVIGCYYKVGGESAECSRCCWRDCFFDMFETKRRWNMYILSTTTLPIERGASLCIFVCRGALQEWFFLESKMATAGKHVSPCGLQPHRFVYSLVLTWHPTRARWLPGAPRVMNPGLPWMMVAKSSWESGRLPVNHVQRCTFAMGWGITQHAMAAWQPFWLSKALSYLPRTIARMGRQPRRPLRKVRRAISWAMQM